MTYNDQIDAIVHDIYGTILDPGRWPSILSAIEALIDGEACCISFFDFEEKKGRIELHSGCFEAGFVDAYATDYSTLDPWMQCPRRYEDDEAAWLGRDLLAPSQLLKTDFYREWLLPQDLFHRCCAVIRREGDEVLYLACLRAKTAGSFQRQHLRHLSQLASHMRQVVEVYRSLGQSQSERAPSLYEIAEQMRDAANPFERKPSPLALERRGNASPCGKCLEGSDSAPIEAAASGNPYRQSTGGGGGSAHAQLEASRTYATLSRRRAEDPRAVGRAWPPTRWQASHGGNAEASLRPRPADEAVSFAAGSVVEPEEAAQENIDKLRGTCGLTRSEARIALLVAQGMSPPEIAAILHKSVTTVRTHLHRVFEKTGTHSQSELVAFLLVGPPNICLQFRGDVEHAFANA